MELICLFIGWLGLVWFGLVWLHQSVSCMSEWDAQDVKVEWILLPAPVYRAKCRVMWCRAQMA
jgi:hypothetical protein